MNYIKSFFNPALEDNINLFDKTKYILSYRILLFLSLAVGVLSVIYSFTNSIGFCVPIYIGFVLITSTFIYIKKTKKYKGVMLFFNFFGALLCVSTLFFFPNESLISSSLWMVVSTNFAFITSGRKVGAMITAINGFALALFFYVYPSFQHIIPIKLSEFEIIGMCINILTCFLLFFYFNWQNITTSKKAEIQIQNANKSLQEQLSIINSQNSEKTILLKEIHHRVKNNLQVIISLLRLQQANNKNEEENSKFNESIGRIMAMSLIHEKIYQTEDFSKINFKAYLEKLATDMIHSFQVDREIDLKITSEVDAVNLKAIVPLALIFNELLSNSIKYAFKNIQNPKITIQFNKMNDKGFTLEYKDNGEWKIPTNSNSFGIELIEALTEQLSGSYTIDFTNGTNYFFHFDNMNA